MAYKYDFDISTDIGLYREDNQDLAGVLENDSIFFAILCDGMGGHYGGAIASYITIQTFSQAFKKDLPDFSYDEEENKQLVVEWFTRTVNLCKENMIENAHNEEKKLDMGTTLTAAFIFKDSCNVIIFNIGDSRTYVQNGQLHQITIDQNLMNHYISKNMYDYERARNMHGSTSLVSSLGPWKNTTTDIYVVKENDSNPIKYLILTSDGIHDFITKDELNEIIVSSDQSLFIKNKSIINLAKESNSTDNLTIISIEVKNV